MFSRVVFVICSRITVLGKPNTHRYCLSNTIPSMNCPSLDGREDERKEGREGEVREEGGKEGVRK